MVYADFFTMAAIAITQSVGIVKQQRVTGVRKRRRRRFPRVLSLLVCVLIWTLSFLLISPAEKIPEKREPRRPLDLKDKMNDEDEA